MNPFRSRRQRIRAGRLFTEGSLIPPSSVLSLVLGPVPGLALSASLLLGATSLHAAEPFEFALIGDYPYFPRDDAGFPNLLDDLRGDSSLAWILHVGDLHNPRATDCTEALYRSRLDLFTSLGPPFIFTPGDNDWSDCKSEEQSGKDFLALVRTVFFPEVGQLAGAPDFSVRSQAAGEDFPEVVENVIWEREGVVFATLHMIAFSGLSIFDDDREERERLVEAGEAWLDHVFRVAQETDARGVFVALQADPWPTSGSARYFEALEPKHLNERSEFSGFKEKLVEHARRFRRPIVVGHGDTHLYRVDKPLHDASLETLQNVTRVEGFGSPDGHWVRVRVEPDREEVFSFRQEWVPENMYTLVPREDRTDGFEDDTLGMRLYILRVLQALPKLLALIGLVSVIRFVYARLRN